MPATTRTATPVDAARPEPLLGSVQRRLGAWADSRVLPVGLGLLLTLDFASGLNWLLSPAANLRAVAYTVAKQVAPMAVWGSLFMLLAAVAAATYLVCGRGWWTGWTLGGLLAGLWAFWAVMLTLAPLGMPGASYAGAVFASCFCGLHVLFGLALSHVPAEARPHHRS